MKRISPERKSAALAKLLPPYNMTVTAVAQLEGISEATLYNCFASDGPCRGERGAGSGAGQQCIGG
ncbi:hypothetical protein, partial [Gibbsiella quercinecans]|uniref:hypothetical protein n=1 Tax=Gibbsiella quercinecans TaxID=929813 RepID=UPI001E5E6839